MPVFGIPTASYSIWPFGKQDTNLLTLFPTVEYLNSHPEYGKVNADGFVRAVKTAIGRGVPQAPRPGGYKNSIGVETGSSIVERAYRLLFGDVSKIYRVETVPYETLGYKGYEGGDWIKIADGLGSNDALSVLAHEYAAKLVTVETGRNHNNVHDKIIERADIIKNQYISRAFRELGRQN